MNREGGGGFEPPIESEPTQETKEKIINPEPKLRYIETVSSIMRSPEQNQLGEERNWRELPPSSTTMGTPKSTPLLKSSRAKSPLVPSVSAGSLFSPFKSLKFL